MPHSLRAKLSGLRYKGILEDKDYKRLCKALDNENVLEHIRAEIENITPKCQIRTGKTSIDTEMMIPQEKVLQIIDKYKGDKE